MNKILRFLSPNRQPKTSDDMLIEFLQQCRIQSVHFLFQTSSIEHQIKTLIQSLNLSCSDTQTRLNAHLTPISTSNLGTAEFFTAMNHDEKQAFPCQMCDNCAPELFKHYGYRVADHSWCSQCHQNGECLDIALIEHYRKHDTICRYLPRKRYQSNVCPLPFALEVSVH